MTLPASKIAPEPDRTGEIAINTLLDLVERQIETLCDLGAEAPLRARLARLLPAPMPPPAPVIEGLDAMELAAVQTALGVVRNRRLAEAEHMAVAKARGLVDTALRAALAAETAQQATGVGSRPDARGAAKRGHLEGAQK